MYFSRNTIIGKDSKWETSVKQKVNTTPKLRHPFCVPNDWTNRDNQKYIYYTKLHRKYQFFLDISANYSLSITTNYTKSNRIKFPRNENQSTDREVHCGNYEKQVE